MLLCKHRTIVFFSGTLWLISGIFLLTLGFRFLTAALPLTETPHTFSMLAWFGEEKVARENGAICLITFALLFGFLKGKYVIGKSAAREIKRVRALPNPTSIKNFYSKRYYILLASMIMLGTLMRHLPISFDTRGFIDILIGSALIKGSMHYFRHLLDSWKERSYE